MIESQIKEVYVYRNGALVKTAGRVQLHSGHQNLKIALKSSTLDTSTVRLHLPAKANATNVQVESLTKEQTEEFLRPVQYQLNLTDSMIAARNTQIEMWNANADFSSKETMNIAEVADYIEKLPARLEKIYGEIEELNQKKKELNNQLKKMKKEAACYYLSVDVDAPGEGECPFEINYYETSASWYPVYEIHSPENDDPTITVRLRAKINQKTQQDFKQVKLTLSTGNPAVSGTIPELSPVRVDFYTPPVFRNMMAMGAAKAAAPMYAMEDTAAMEVVDEEIDYGADEMVETVMPEAAVTQGDTMIEYALNGLWDVSKDNETVVDISSSVIPCRYHNVAVPKADDAGYLAGEVKTSDIADLLKTNALVYHKGTYLGEVYLNADLSQETYDISLGRDETLKVKRIQQKKYTSNVLLKGQKKTEYEYELKVTSAKNKPCQLTVIDQVPLSADKTIVVEHTNISGAALDEKTGKLKWEIELEPNATKSFNLAYSVAWPKDKKLNI